VAILQKWVGYFIALAGGVLSASAFLFGIYNAPFTIPWYLFYLAAALIFFIPILGLHVKSIPFSIPDKWFLVTVALLFILSRVLWIAKIPTQPFSDFYYYDHLANILSTGKPILGNLGIGYEIMSWGYPFILGIIYSIFGHSIWAVKIFNVLIGLCTLLVIFWIGRRVVDSGFAQGVTLLFLFWPSQLIMTSVLASEHLALLVVVLSIGLIAPALNSRGNTIRGAVLPGIILAFAVITRSALWAFFLAVLIAIFLTKGIHKIIFAMLTSFVITYAIYLGGVQIIYHQGPKPGLFDSLLKGTNIKSNGSWNEEDALSFLNSETITQANQKVWREIVRRISEDPLAEIKLAFRKPLLNWSNETYATIWSTSHLEDNCSGCWNNHLKNLWDLISQTYHELILGFGAVGFYHLFRTPSKEWKAEIWMFTLYLIMGTALHMVLESQPRYHYVRSRL
jgi:hypothetical protein